MKLEILNPHTMKIVIAARKEDSISAISKRIGLSYGWTHHWVSELAKAGVFDKSGKRILLNDRNGFYRKALEFIRASFRNDAGFHYSVLGLFGIKYCFTGTDAVFVWTEGGYNISRYRDYYPIFIKVRESDKMDYEFHVKKIDSGGKVFYKPTFLEDFPVSYHRGTPVDSLSDTVEFMRKYKYNFQPALEMIRDTYGKGLGVKYREAAVNA